MTERPAKRVRRESNGTGTSSPFHATLLSRAGELASAYKGAQPYEHGVIDALFREDFLRQAKDEIMRHVSFREKETDIYAIKQSGDFANLDGLPEDERATLSTVLELRDALYSPTFRTFIRSVTGSGPLSGLKTDMSCAIYDEGAYLLNHDDVIGTRRVSWILYLVDEGWQPEWGGALELYPLEAHDEANPDRPNVPTPAPSVSIPPAFNQLAFFRVLPGRSFHSVEEVVVAPPRTRGGTGSRVSISGWFHAPIEGEEGHEEDKRLHGDEYSGGKSSLQQLYATTLEKPQEYAGPLPTPLLTEPSADDMVALAEFIDPKLLEPVALAALRDKFCDESSVVIEELLRPEVAQELEQLTSASDKELWASKARTRTIEGKQTVTIPLHTSTVSTDWTLTGPAHIQRFLALKQAATATTLDVRLGAIRTFMASEPFRAFLACITCMAPEAHTVHARCFRPGLDYTLARGAPPRADGEAQDDEAQFLDVGLALTPSASPAAKREAMRAAKPPKAWSDGGCGGWELWLASDPDTDEATYGAQQEEDDGPLLALEPGWNRLHIVLRDTGVLKFVKYLKSSAPGARWDVTGEWQVTSPPEA